MPKASRTRETIRIARSEWPPSSKKLSSTLTRPTASVSLPDAGELYFDRCPRRNERPSDLDVPRRGKPLSIDLAVRRQRHLVERDDEGRHHVGGQLPRQVRAQLRH